MRIRSVKPSRLTCHRQVRFDYSSPFLIYEKRSHPGWDDFSFGDPERTRTVDLQRDRLAC